MQDIEMLVEPPKNLKKVIIYEYSDGVLRPEVHRVLRSILTAKGIPIREVEPEQVAGIMRGGSLFGNFCLWVDTSEPPKGVVEWLSGKEQDNYCFLSINKKDDPALIELPAYITLCKAATVIKEVQVTARNVSKVINFLVGNSLKKNNIILSNTESAEIGIGAFYDRSQPGLGELAKFVEKVLIVCVGGDQFNTVGFNDLLPDKAGANFFEWHTAVYNLITDGNTKNRNSLMQLISNDLGGTSEHRQVMGKLFRVVQELSYVNHNLNKAGTKPDNISDYKWRNMLHFSGLRPLRILKLQIILVELEIEINMSGCLTSYKLALDKMKDK